MYIPTVSSINFNAGIVDLQNVAREKLSTYEVIKDFAKEKSVDVFITKNQRFEHVTNENFYTIIAKSLNNEKMNKGFSFAVVSKRSSTEEISLSIFNAVVNAVENLGKNLTAK